MRQKVLAIVLVICICIIEVSGIIRTNTSMEVKAEVKTGHSSDENSDDFVDMMFEHSFKIQNEWHQHYNAEMTLKNVSEDLIENWEIAFMFDGEIENIWNAKIISHSDNIYVIKNASWNQDIKADASVSFGFTVAYEGEKPEEPYNVDMEKMEYKVVDGYEINFKQFTKYENKIQGLIEITNTSDNYIEDWSLIFDSNINIIDIWNAKISETSYNYDEEDEEQTEPVGMHYFMENAGYNQNIEPGQTINFGFIAELIKGEDAVIDNELLYQLTVMPDTEDDTISDDDCIWEGDEVIVNKSYVTDEELDDDDYDQIEKDDIADGSSRKLLRSNANSLSESEGENGIQLQTENDGKTNSDKISFYIYGLPHKKQVQSWCMKGSAIFVAQNDEEGNSVISLCERTSSGTYEYKSEMQVSGAGHTQSLYCYKRKSGKYFLLINSHIVNFGTDIDWGTRFSRVIYDTNANGKNKDGKKAKNIMKTEHDSKKMNLKRTFKGDDLKYFKAVAYARRQTQPFAGMSKRKGVAKLKRCDFGISPDKKYMVIWKKSGSGNVEYSVFDWEKLLSAFKSAKKYITFNSEEVRALCKYDCYEKVGRVAKRSFQGIAMDNSSNIIITSGNNRLQEEKPNTDKYITIFFKKANKKQKNITGYTSSKEVMLVRPEYNSSTWMKDMVRSKAGTEGSIPALEIEGVNVIKDKVYFAVGIPKNENISGGIYNGESWKTRTFIFSRNLTDLYD